MWHLHSLIHVLKGAVLVVICWWAIGASTKKDKLNAHYALHMHVTLHACLASFASLVLCWVQLPHCCCVPTMPPCRVVHPGHVIEVSDPLVDHIGLTREPAGLAALDSIFTKLRMVKL